MTEDYGDSDPDDLGDDYVEVLDDGFLFGEPPPPPALQQGVLLGPELLLNPYQRGSGRYPTIRLYDADGNELVWQELYRPIDEVLNGDTWTVTFGITPS